MTIVYLVGALLRLAWIGQAPYWYDEAFTVLLTRLPFMRMIAATAGDTHPPLWYVIEWVWSRMAGEGETAMRLPAALFAILAMPLFVRMMRSLRVPERVMMPAAWAMALMPFQVFYAQEARMYSLLICLVLLAVIAIAERRWWLVSLAVALLLWTHNYGLFYAAVLGMLAAWRARVVMIDGKIAQLGELRQVLLAFGLAGVSWLPWAWVLAGQMATVSAGYWITMPTAGSVLMSLISLMWADAPLWMSIPCGLVVFGGLSWGTWRLFCKQRAWAVLWLAWAPIAAAVVASLVWRPVYLFRGLAGAAPFLMLVLVWPLAQQSARRRIYAAILVLPLLLGGVVNHYVNSPKGFPGGQIFQLIAMLEQEWQPGDILYMVNDGPVLGTLTYAPWLDGSIYEMPECPGARTRGALSPATRAAMGLRQVALDELDYGRAWVVWVQGTTSTQCEADRAAAIVGDQPKYFSFGETDLVKAGVWLLEDRSFGKRFSATR